MREKVTIKLHKTCEDLRIITGTFSNWAPDLHNVHMHDYITHQWR